MILTTNKEIRGSKLLSVLERIDGKVLGVSERYVYEMKYLSPIEEVSFSYGFFISQLLSPTKQELQEREKFYCFLTAIFDELREVDEIFIYNKILNNNLSQEENKLNEIYEDVIITNISQIPEDKFTFEFHKRYCFRICNIVR